MSRQFGQSLEGCRTHIHSIVCELDTCKAEAEDGVTLAQLKRMISFREDLGRLISRMMDSHPDGVS